MAKRRSRVDRIPETVFRSVGEGVERDVETILRRAPQFEALAKAAGGQQGGVSESQLKFLEEFTSQLKTEPRRDKSES